MKLVVNNAPQPKPDPLLRLPDVEAATGIRKSTLYALMKRGEFPRCVQVTPRCVGWRARDVEAWINAREVKQ
ncbi:helix-turn-helix transcriptional regulator [Roseateles sp.]|uniref:helix-turn-helix transcriptional regulator n=1 Tax=Roseateles sp. TaxID=1971397 RepID=UPI003920C903